MKRLLTSVIAVALAGCASSQYESGTEALKAGNYARAEMLLTQAVKDGDDPAESWNNLGVAYQRQGKIEQSKQAYTMAARYGNPLAQQNLQKMNAPIPNADLAHTINGDGAIGAAYVIGIGSTLRNRNKADPMPLEQHQTTDNNLMRKVGPPKSYDCTSRSPGRATCTEQ